ncbi:hypothetical protein V1478_002275 [Vespula squamosa]|uniref:Uncharacterized protein n=1 Tax=Vespula squamosa TaxID=30214 RepID=A0ABD2BPT7_VESSQ
MEDGRSERSRITGTSQHPYVHVPLFKKTSPRNDYLFSAEYTKDVRSNLFARKYLLPIRLSYKASISDPGPTARRLLHSGTHGLTGTLLYNSRSEMPFRFGSFRLLSPLEMGETPLTEGSTVHSVCFRHLETRPVVSIFRYFKDQNGVLEVPLVSV